MKKVLFPVLPALVGILVWHLRCDGVREREFLFGSPSLLFWVAAEDLPTMEFWSECGTTLFEALSGLAAGAILGSLSGLFLWGCAPAARMLRPYVVVFGCVPLFAVAPLFIIWFGSGVTSKCVMSGFAVYFVSLQQAFDGAANSSKGLSLYLQGLGASKVREVQKIIIPGALSWMVSGFRMNIGFAFLGAFIGELASSDSGLGHYVFRAGSLYDMPRVFLGISVLAAIILLLNALVSRFFRRTAKSGDAWTFVPAGAA